MDNPLKLNLQEKNDTSLLPEGVDYQAMAESRVVCIGQEDDISDSICSEQFKVCVVCVCACGAYSHISILLIRPTFINTLFPVPRRKFSKCGREGIIINN